MAMGISQCLCINPKHIKGLLLSPPQKTIARSDCDKFVLKVVLRKMVANICTIPILSES